LRRNDQTTLSGSKREECQPIILVFHSC
jgi:hypothetical protein